MGNADRDPIVLPRHDFSVVIANTIGKTNSLSFAYVKRIYIVHSENAEGTVQNDALSNTDLFRSISNALNLWYEIGCYPPFDDNFTTSQRNWYNPDLQDMYWQNSLYSYFVDTRFSFADARTTTMFLDELISAHANIDPVSQRTKWLNSSRIDSRRRQLTFAKYAGKLAYEEYDDLITFWRKDRVAGLRRIIQGELGKMMMTTLDLLARNAFLTSAYRLYGAGSGFNNMSDTDRLTTSLIESIHLGMAERGVPYATGPEGINGNIICITSPGAYQDLRNEASSYGNGNMFIDLMKRASPQAIIRNQRGIYDSVSFLTTNRAILYNSGPITQQSTITAAVEGGSGASSATVDGVYDVGQPSGVNNYIPVSSVSNFAVNDMVTIHVDRTNAYGVSDGVDHTDGKLHYRRIVAINEGGSPRLSFDKPIMEDFDTDLGGGVYGYVTKGKHVHTAIFIAGNDGVANGVMQPPTIITPPPVDDLQEVHRFSWKGRFKYQMFHPEVVEAVFLAGPNRPGPGPVVRSWA